MGGVGGHMMHLYDNPLLTFNEMREIFDLAASGTLKGTEKTDGQNLFISYSIKDGKAKAARNKSNIKAGGLTATELAEKFAGRGSLEKTFVESFEAFERVAQRLSPEQQENIFGPDTNIYYSAEVLDPRSVNVINYDTKSLVIHRSASEFDRNTGNPTDRDVSGNIAFLSDALENEQENIAQDDYGVQLDAIQDLQEFLDQEFLQEIQSRLTDLLKEQSISDDQTILDFMISKIKKTLYNDYNLAENISREVLKYIITSNSIIKDKYNITRRASKNNIVKLAQNPEEAKNAKEAMNNTKEIMSDSLMGLEDIVHDFSVEAVKGLRSLFILDDKQEKEMLRLRRETERAITAIENSGNEEAMFILQKQMKKLKSLENINTASEGFVFDYDGSTYKFTGNFAPMNQLLGLFKYGRGSVPPLEKLDEFSISDSPSYSISKPKKYVVLIPGGFKPPHRGHYAMIENYAKMTDVEAVVVLSGDKPREGVTKEMSQELFDLYGGLSDKVQFVDDNQPLRAAFEKLGEEDFVGRFSDGVTFVMGCSNKGADEARATNFAKWFKNNPDKNVLNVDVGVLGACAAEMGGGEIPLSASSMRKAAREVDDETLKAHIPKNVDIEAVKAILPKSLEEVRESFSLPFLDALVEEVMDEAGLKKTKSKKKEEELEEMSTAGGSAGSNGSVEGSPRRGIDKRDSDTMIRQ